MWSGDSTTTPLEIAEAVAETGIDVLCVTDHGTTKGAERLAVELECLVVVGQEQRTPDGEVIGLFLRERIPAGLRSAAEAANFIRSQGGIVYIPHPFDPMRHRISAAALEGLAKDGLVDVVEVRNAKTSLEHLNVEALTFADRHELCRGAGSDAHVPEAIGAAYVEMRLDEVTPAGFLAGLRAGRVCGHHYDSARVWRPRIVPSVAEANQADPTARDPSVSG
jgi:predicted metal-dependent phosphoesterase TrpH